MRSPKCHRRTSIARSIGGLVLAKHARRSRWQPHCSQSTVASAELADNEMDAAWLLCRVACDRQTGETPFEDSLRQAACAAVVGG